MRGREVHSNRTGIGTFVPEQEAGVVRIRPGAPIHVVTLIRVSVADLEAASVRLCGPLVEWWSIISMWNWPIRDR